MANILIIDDDRDLRRLVQVVLAKSGHNPTLTMDGKEGLAAAQMHAYDLVIVDVMMPDLDGYEVTRRLRADPRTQIIPILILTARTQPADQESARVSGADGYLSKPFNHTDLTSKVETLLKIGQERRAEAQSLPNSAASAAAVQPLPQAAPTRPGTGAQVLTVLSLRGGVGATTVAVNVAAALSRAGRRTCLVDLSPNGGQMALHLRLRPQLTWANLPPQADSQTIGKVITRHPSGLFVLAAPPLPVRHGLVGEAFLSALLIMRSVFTDIIVDAAPSLDNATCTALKSSRNLLLVLTPESVSIQTAISTLHTCTELQLTTAAVRLVLNQTSSEPGLPLGAVEKALGQTPEVQLPYDRAQATALNQGAPLVVSNPQAPLAAAFTALAAKLQ